MTARLVRCDARGLPLPAGSVDLIVTSPPYFALRSYQDGDEHYEGQVGSEETPQAFLEALWSVAEECWRVLKPTGSMFVNLGDKYAGSGGHNNSGISEKSTLRGNGHVGGVGKAGPQKIKATRRSAPDRYTQSTHIEPMNVGEGVGRQMVPGRTKGYAGIRPKSLMGLPWRFAIGCIERGWILRRDLIWDKPNGLPESVKDRCRSSHEYWFHLTKEGSYFANLSEVRLPAERSGLTWDERKAIGPVGCPDNGHSSGGPGMAAHPEGKLPPSVWSIATEPLIVSAAVREQYGLPDHFAAFPQEWPRRLVLGWSPPGGVVLDPFGGTGTVAGVAAALGRVGVSADLSHDYCRLAKWRIERSGHFAKTASRTDGERQGSLMEVS